MADETYDSQLQRNVAWVLKRVQEGLKLFETQDLEKHLSLANIDLILSEGYVPSYEFCKELRDRIIEVAPFVWSRNAALFESYLPLSPPRSQATNIAQPKIATPARRDIWKAFVSMRVTYYDAERQFGFSRTMVDDALNGPIDAAQKFIETTGLRDMLQEKSPGSWRMRGGMTLAR